MGIHYDDLDKVTRQHMQDEWKLGNHYISPRLNQDGKFEWPKLLLEAATHFDDDWLANKLLQGRYFRDTEDYTRNGKLLSRQINKESSATQLAEGEFNRLYVRALCLRAREKGFSDLIVYRGKAVAQPRTESQEKIGRSVSAADLLNELRKNDFVSVDSALGVPAGPNSGLTCKLP
jgi:hypothetical protein